MPIDNGNYADQSSNEPESSYVYFFTETCELGGKYFTELTFKITDTYETDIVYDEGSGYYVVIGVDTNLTKDDFSNERNFTIFHATESLFVDLYFVTYAEDKKELVYEIEKNKDINYPKLLTLIALETKDYVVPYIAIRFDIFDTYCVVNGENYVSKSSIINLEYTA